MGVGGDVREPGGGSCATPGRVEVGASVGIAGGTEDLVLVVPQDLQPGAEVGGVGVRVVGDAALGHQEDAGELGPQLFLGIVEISKAVALIQGLAV